RWPVDGSVPLDPPASDILPLDLALNASSLGARVLRASSVHSLREALADVSEPDGPVVIYVEADRYAGVPSYESWWDVPVAEVSDEPSVQAAREEYERALAAQRHYLETPND